MSTKSKITWLAILAAAISLIFWYAKTRPHYDNITSPRPTQGDAQSKVILEEFSDFQCPACRAAQPAVEQILRQFGDKILFKYKHFPLLSIHANAFNAALAAECANDQGKFWEYHDLLFANQDNLRSSRLVNLAVGLGLNQESFAACLGSRAKSSVVTADMNEGTRRNVNSTPSFFVNGAYVPNWQILPELIGAEAGETATTTQQ